LWAEGAKPLARILNEVYLRIAFSTKHRANIVHARVEAELRNYIAGIIANIDSGCIAISGQRPDEHGVAYDARYLWN